MMLLFAAVVPAAAREDTPRLMSGERGGVVAAAKSDSLMLAAGLILATLEETTDRLKQEGTCAYQQRSKMDDLWTICPEVTKRGGRRLQAQPPRQKTYRPFFARQAPSMDAAGTMPQDRQLSKSRLRLSEGRDGDRDSTRWPSYQGTS
jgi:hypothetical protein